jgi:hypothetical protein
MIDKFWLGFNVFAASVAECNLSIFCACAPSLKALFGRYFHGLTTKMSDISETDLQSRVESTQQNTSIRPGSDKFTRGIGNNKGLNCAMSIERHPNEVYLQDILEVSKIGNERRSFKEAHEYGMESLGRITEAYEEPPYLHESTATVPIFLDTESVRTGINYNDGAHSLESPSISANPFHQETTSPHSSLTSEVPADDERSETSSFSFINLSESSSGQGDETHLISTSANHQYFLVPPRYIQQSSSKQSPSSKPLRPPTPAILRTPSSSALSPLSVTLWTSSMTKTILNDNAGPSSRRKLSRKLNKKLSREKWEQKKKKNQFEQTAYPAI